MIELIREILLRPGFTVFWVIETSVVLLFLVSILGRPRMLRVTAVFLGSFAILLLLFIITVWLLGAVLASIVPQR